MSLYEEKNILLSEDMQMLGATTDSEKVKKMSIKYSKLRRRK